MSACNRLAAREVEKEFATDDKGLGGGNTYQAQMMRYDAGKRQKQFFNHCMRAKGYIEKTKE
ncbi:MAG: hypothetical protein OEY85_06540 [Rhodospirillales bacterium]|nr:hypothetical protein [Rhodospirillales bacterium]